VKRAPASPIPLARLLAMAYRQLIDELHRRLAASGYDDVRPASFGYVLLAVRDRPTTGADVAQLLGVTKQAASKLIDGMERDGYVRRSAHDDDARAKAIEITARGRKFLTTVEAIYAAIEADWAGITSRKRMEAIRSDLRLIVEAAHGGQVPPVRPTP
jgi:DNA-binding MarR family transcriptional regulator